MAKHHRLSMERYHWKRESNKDIREPEVVFGKTIDCMTQCLLKDLQSYFRSTKCSDKIFRLVEESVDCDTNTLQSGNTDIVQVSDVALEQKFVMVSLQKETASAEEKVVHNSLRSKKDSNLTCSQGNDVLGDCELVKCELTPSKVNVSGVLIPIHSMLLCIHSTYFKELIENSNMGEDAQNEITIKVKEGEGVYFETLIHSFYNPTVLSNICILEMLQVLHLADMFSCAAVVDQLLQLLELVEITSVEECNKLIAFFLQYPTLNHKDTSKTFNLVKRSCSDFLSQTFHRLESNLGYHKSFTQMSHDSFLTLLTSEIAFLYHENNLIHFIKLWLSENEACKTEQHIKALIDQCCYESMSPEYLATMVSPDDSILATWKGWNGWCYKAMSYHLLAKNQNTFHGVRNTLHDVTSRKGHVLPFLNTQLCEMTLHYEDGMFKQTSLSEGSIVYKGLVLLPELHFKESEVEAGVYDITLHITFPSLYEEDCSLDLFHFECMFTFTLHPVNKMHWTFSVPSNETLYKTISNTVMSSDKVLSNTLPDSTLSVFSNFSGALPATTASTLAEGTAVAVNIENEDSVDERTVDDVQCNSAEDIESCRNQSASSKTSENSMFTQWNNANVCNSVLLDKRVEEVVCDAGFVGKYLFDNYKDGGIRVVFELKNAHSQGGTANSLFATPTTNAGGLFGNSSVFANNSYFWKAEPSTAGAKFANWTDTVGKPHPAASNNMFAVSTPPKENTSSYGVSTPTKDNASIFGVSTPIKECIEISKHCRGLFGSVRNDFSMVNPFTGGGGASGNVFSNVRLPVEDGVFGVQPYEP